MADSIALTEFKQGVKKLRESRSLDALQHFRRAAEMEKSNPYFLSFVGVSMARAERRWDPALQLCESALNMKRNDAQLYLNLAEVYTSAGRREEALITLERGLASLGPVARIQQARLRLGQRRAPALPFLGRENIVNRQIGIVRHRIMEWFSRSRAAVLHSS